LLRCFDSVRQHQQYWNKWILDEGWIDIINHHLQILFGWVCVVVIVRQKHFGVSMTFRNGGESSGFTSGRESFCVVGFPCRLLLCC
jgi:hypothetical protein